MATSKIFGSNLKRIREDLKLSQEKFAELLDVQTRSLSDIENGKYLPRPENIDKICEKLNIPVLDNKKLSIIYNIVYNAFN